MRQGTSTLNYWWLLFCAQLLTIVCFVFVAISRSLELQGLRREVERLQRTVQRQESEHRDELRQLQAELREVRQSSTSDSHLLNVQADIRNDLASIKTLMYVVSSCFKWRGRLLIFVIVDDYLQGLRLLED